MTLEIVGLGETFNLTAGDIIHYAQVCVSGITGQTLDIEISKESYDTLKEVAATLLQHEQESQDWERSVSIPSVSAPPAPIKKISLEEAMSGEWEEEENLFNNAYKGPFAGVEASPVGEVILSGMGHVPS